MSTLSSDVVQEIIAFHGHFCPGLATGIRVSEIALREIGAHSSDEEIVAVVETLNCAVDAIQYLTGCTIGKGNLLHLDYGRNAFVFARRSDGKAIRISNKPRNSQLSTEEEALVSRVRGGQASKEESERYSRLWARLGQDVLDSPEDELFVVQELQDYPLPPKATVVPSAKCDMCGELVMSNRMTQLDDRNLCPSCFGQSPTHSLTEIGVVENDLVAGKAAPRARSERSVVRVLPQYVPALNGIKSGDNVEVFFVFDRSNKALELLQHPRGDHTASVRGVFSLRSPLRPSGIGVTVVDVLEVTSDGLIVQGLDAWDGTPVVDIKPTLR